MVWYRIKRGSLEKLITDQTFWRIHTLGGKTEAAQENIYNLLTKIFKIFMSTSGFLLLFVFIQPLFFKRRTLPLLCYQPINFLESPYYELVYIWQFSNCLFIFIFVISLSMTFYSALAFGFCQTMMLKESIINLKMETQTKESEENCYKKMREYIEYHSKLLR